MLYFAYGSNMDWIQMRKRCPSALFMCIAKLMNHDLRFTHKSTKRDCGVADCVVESGNDVWGAVFKLDERDIGALDASEGYAPGRKENAYVRTECHVCEDGDEKKPIAVMAYFVDKKQSNVPLPSAEYMHQIIEGAIYWHLPSEYVRRLETIRTSASRGA